MDVATTTKEMEKGALPMLPGSVKRNGLRNSNGCPMASVVAPPLFRWLALVTDSQGPLSKLEWFLPEAAIPGKTALSLKTLGLYQSSKGMVRRRSRSARYLSLEPSRLPPIAYEAQVAPLGHSAVN
ncbi:hypothetical protein F66182_3816 [Fusarium sp. NRRL 66182]|nr:hypothetical protein F66182_3816 [Fusarium sp. NRRL 66182]